MYNKNVSPAPSERSTMCSANGGKLPNTLLLSAVRYKRKLLGQQVTHFIKSQVRLKRETQLSFDLDKRLLKQKYFKQEKKLN